MKVYGRSDSDKGRASSRFQEAYRQIGVFRRETKVSTWSIARHLAYGHLRRTKCRHDEKHETIEFLRADQADASAMTLDAVETSERKRIVHDALQELPEHYRRVVQRCDLEEKSTAETVEHLGLTEGNVRGRLHRARKTLCDLLCERMECERSGGTSFVNGALFPAFGDDVV